MLDIAMVVLAHKGIHTLYLLTKLLTINYMNPKLFNGSLIAICVLGFALCVYVAMLSIDKVTARDCNRGILSACQYVK